VQGSVFRVKLFLPEVLAAGAAGVQAGAAAPGEARPRRAYAGARRRILVVDNEEADRELLVHLLEPLGFELRTAASGHDCLDLLAAGYRPDVILMDLAMPGIDGWETIRRLRALGLAHARVAIVSANAFDKGLDNDVAHPPEDFILKPVRHSELLDWLERQLGLPGWTRRRPGRQRPTPAPAARPGWPSSRALTRCKEVVPGLLPRHLNQLDQIEAAQPASAPWWRHARAGAAVPVRGHGPAPAEVADGG
jgi:CheY-like chemotaxis protein